MKTKRNRKILSGLFALALLATTAVGVAESKKSEAKMSDLALKNILALADVENPNLGEEGGGDGTLWTRLDGDCTYTFTGEAGSIINFKILGVPFSVTIGVDGTASYTYPGGKTNCTAGGQEQCMARYCPPL